MKKKLTFLLVALLASLRMTAHVPRVVQSDDRNVAKIGSTEYATLQAAVDAAHEMTGDVTVELIDDITDLALVHQKAGLNLIIDGADHKIAGQIIIDGDGRASGTETLTIQSVNFEGDASNFYTGTDAFILVPSTKDTDKIYTTGSYNYAHNVTISNCSFTSTSDNYNTLTNKTEYDVVGVKATSGAGLYNIKIDGSTGTNLHSLAQLTGTTGGTVTNNTVTAGESFLNVSGGDGEFTVSGNTFTRAENADGYGVRENGTSTATITLTDNSFTAANAVVLGKGDIVTAGTINVVSGTYVGEITKTAASTGKIVISGGSFSATIGDAKYSQFILEGLTGVNGVNPGTPTPNGFGDVVATVTYGEGDVSNYGSFEAAAKAADGEYVITLLQNITDVYTMSVGETLKVAKNGKSLKTPKGPDEFAVQDTTTDGVTTYTLEPADYMLTDLKGNVSYGSFNFGSSSPSTLSTSGTYKLLKDTSVIKRMNIGSSNTDATLDLNGHVLTLTASDYGILSTRSGSAAYIKYFNLIDNSDAKGGKLVVPNTQAICINGNYNYVTIGEGVTVEGSVNLLKANDKLDVYGTIIGGDDFAVSTNGSATTNATINIYEGAVLTSDIVAMYLPGTGTTTISGGEITGATAIEIRSGELDITGGIITGNGEKKEYVFVSGHSVNTGDAVLIENCGYPGGAPVVSITGGTMKSTNAEAVASYIYGENEQVVGFATGGFYSNQIPQEYCAEGYICAPYNEELYIVRQAEYVAQIGDVKYESLAEAVAAVPADGTETTITMIDNEMINVVGYAVTIPATKNIVLDLNGYQIVGTVEQEGTSALIRNLGTLTIKDSSDTNADGTGTGKLMSGASPTWTWDGTDDYSGSYASNLIRNEKNLTVESGYLYNMSSGSAAYAIDNYYAGNITINGGKVDAAKASAIRMFYVNGGSITVTGGVIGHYVSDDNCSYMGIQVMGGTNVNVSITGGTIVGNYALYANNTGGNIEISGGTFDGYVGFNAAVPDISISGGAYTESVKTWGDQTKFVSGGIFADVVDGEYIADGYILTSNTDEATKDEYPYMVKPGAYVAQNMITNKKYDDLQIAINAVESGETIKLLANVTLADDLTADKSFTLKTEGFTFDPAGHTITIQEGVTVNVEIAASIINNFASAVDGFNVEETVTANGYAYSLKAVENLDLATIDEGYYHIKNLGNNKYVNVVGRRTALVNLSEEDAAKSAGAVIKVKTTNGKVEILRSQAVDIPSYAQRAMRYVPEVVTLVVEKLGVDGSGKILGENGVDAILTKFYDEFDYNLYVENCGEGYRIFGRTPSMQPVLDFYKENKENVDAKLPGLEQAINDAISKVVNKIGRGYSLEGSFQLHTIWERMGATNLTEPNDDDSKLAFLQEVLSSKNHVWNFAYQTATYYAEMVEGKLDQIEGIPADMDVSKYIELAKKIRPDFKYYIVQKDGKLDIISEGNTDIINPANNAIWQLEEATAFTLNVPKENVRIVGATFDGDGKRTGFETGYYTTLYTDFGYRLPEGAVALKVTEIADTYLGDNDNPFTYNVEDVTFTLGLVKTKEIGQEVPAQTPVLIMSKTADEPITLEIGDNFGANADLSGNQLHGVDWLIDKYEINTPMLDGIFKIAAELSASTAEKYEHLIRRNAGTVNNKYFFGLDIGEDLAPAYKKKNDGKEMKSNPILILGKKEGKKLAFNADNESWGKIGSNTAFLFGEKSDPDTGEVVTKYNPALFSLLGDVTRNGVIDVEDVTGQVNIIQERDKEEYNYDYDAADVTEDEEYFVDVDDVTGLVNIIQLRAQHPDLP